MQRLTESEIIRRAAERFNQVAQISGVEVGIGDDAAVLKLCRSETTSLRHLLTTDTLVEGVHFEVAYTRLCDICFKALAVNLSDINAMGGESIAALGSLGVPSSAQSDDVNYLLSGVGDAVTICHEAGQRLALVGGDTISAPQWIVGFTVLGTVEGQPILRSGARPGDLVWHSRDLGLSGVGLEVLRATVAARVTDQQARWNETYNRAVFAHWTPSPPLALGPWLQRNGYATAAQDLSDSLSQVALQMAEASGVGIELDFRGYEFAPPVADYAKKIKAESVAKLLLAQAEDYQLLFTTPPEFAEQMASAPVPCRRIGRVIEAGLGNRYFDEHGATHELKAVGFEHL